MVSNHGSLHNSKQPLRMPFLGGPFGEEQEVTQHGCIARQILVLARSNQARRPA